MARRIVCENCNNDATKAVAELGEVWETIKGTATGKMQCDDCYRDISVGDTCFCGVLIDKKSNSRYKEEHPSRWASGYIDIVSEEQKQ